MFGIKTNRAHIILAFKIIESVFLRCCNCFHSLRANPKIRTFYHPAHDLNGTKRAIKNTNCQSVNEHERSSSYYGLCLRIWFIRSVFIYWAHSNATPSILDGYPPSLRNIYWSIHKEKEKGKNNVEKRKQTKLELDKTKPNKIGPRDIETCLT